MQRCKVLLVAKTAAPSQYVLPDFMPVQNVPLAAYNRILLGLVSVLAVSLSRAEKSTSVVARDRVPHL